MIDDSERRLIQVASVVNAIGRAENASAPAVFEWLLQQSDGGVHLPRLWSLGRSTGEVASQCSAESSVRRWRSMAQRANDRRLDELPMPTEASTWHVHAKDLLALLDCDLGWTEAVRAELQALAARRLPPQRQATAIASPATTPPEEPAPLIDAAPPPDRGQVLKKAVLVKTHQHQWPTISDDLNHAAANGLRDAARALERGYWWEADALQWAKSRGKLLGTAGSAVLQTAWAPARPLSTLGAWPGDHGQD